jgi:hypothetical protein
MRDRRDSGVSLLDVMGYTFIKCISFVYSCAMDFPEIVGMDAKKVSV